VLFHLELSIVSEWFEIIKSDKKFKIGNDEEVVNDQYQYSNSKSSMEY